MAEGPITLSRSRYNQLIAAENHLDLLHANGVDNWDGYCSPDDDEEEDD